MQGFKIMYSLRSAIGILCYFVTIWGEWLKFLVGRLPGGEMDARDRISELPEHLVHHILSFLGMKDVIRTSTLSNSWKNACAASPILEFDVIFFRGAANQMLRTRDSSTLDEESTGRKREQVVNFVEQSLQARLSQGIIISKLVLPIPFSFFCSGGSIHVDRWIGYAVKCHIQHLTLNINVVHCLPERYSLPLTLFSANSLTMLTLRGCKIELPPTSNVKFSLKKLDISYSSLDDHCFQNLIGCSKDLKHLKLDMCSGLKRVKITGHLKLKKVYLRTTNDVFREVSLDEDNLLESFEIDAMNLEEFFYEGDDTPLEINMRACKNLKSLSLHNATIAKKWFLHLLSNLPYLNLLSLRDCNMLEKIKISSHSLTTLSICSLKNLEELVIDTPNLISFAYSGDVISISCNIQSLLKPSLHIIPNMAMVGDSWFSRQVEFLGMFSHCKVVELKSTSDSYVDVLVPKELREALVPPLYNVKHLLLDVSGQLKSLVANAAAEIVDGLLWICPHPETLTIVSNVIKKSIKFFYDEVMDKQGNLCPCCKSLPIGCWRHCLKEVMIENTLLVSKRDTLLVSKSKIKDFSGFGDETNLKKFFLENAEILEKMDDLTDCELKSGSWLGNCSVVL